MESRVKEIDYLKCVFIILMIVFHLVYIGDKYPYAKQVVYTFHMSAFLVISGYLAGTGKDARSFLRKFLWIFIPYACMEAAYTVMSRFLPVRDGVAQLSPALLLDKIFLHPMGPYWYLHTLILCSLVYYAAFRWCGERLSVASRLVVTGVCLFAVSYWGGVMNFSNALYFLLGAVVSQGGLGFAQVFRATPLAVVPLVMLCCFPANLDRGTLAGVAITWLVVSLLLSIYVYLPESVRRFSFFVGRNTLVVLLFSPIFTMLSKALLPLFAFDPTGMLFMVVATAFTLVGSLGMAWGMDRLHVSRFFFGRGRVLG